MVFALLRGFARGSRTPHGVRARLRAIRALVRGLRASVVLVVFLRLKLQSWGIVDKNDESATPQPAKMSFRKFAS